MAVTMMQIEDHVRPTWPEPGQVHLDISVTELDDAVARSVTFGDESAQVGYFQCHA